MVPEKVPHRDFIVLLFTEIFEFEIVIETSVCATLWSRGRFQIFPHKFGRTKILSLMIFPMGPEEVTGF